MKRLLTVHVAWLLLCVPALLVNADGLETGAKNAAPGEAPPARVDCFGDPLPAGVLARIGSVRLDCEESIRSGTFTADGKSLSVLSETREKQLWFFDVDT